MTTETSKKTETMPGAIPVRESDVRQVPEIPFNEGFFQVSESDREKASGTDQFILNG
jgi:hypothetical protein